MLATPPPDVPRETTLFPRLGWRVRTNVALASLSCVCYGAALLSPSTFWPAGFLAYGIPFMLAINLFWLLYWLLVRPVFALISAVTLLLGYQHLASTFALAGPKPGDSQIKVLSYNVQTFYGYVSGPADRVIKATKILRWLNKSQADVLCLQEFYDRPSSYIFNTSKRLKQAGFTHRSFSPAIDLGKKGKIGMVILSKYPILKSGTLYQQGRSNNQIMFADIRLKGDTVRIFNVHLQSNRIEPQELEENDSREAVKQHSKSIFGKMRRAFVKRGEQIEALLQGIEASPHPVIVCGDFNELPYSYAYKQLDNRLQNAFEAAGWGLGFTYNGGLPGLRIDNQFASSSLEVQYFTTHRVPLTDHYPLEAGYRWKGR